MPVVTPAADTVATLVLLLLHIPPVVLLVRAVVLPAHILADPPVIATGLGFTVTITDVGNQWVVYSKLLLQLSTSYVCTRLSPHQ